MSVNVLQCYNDVFVCHNDMHTCTMMYIDVSECVTMLQQSYVNVHTC